MKMKNYWAIIGLMFVFFVGQSCKKTVEQRASIYEETINNIKIQEPISLTFNAGNNSNVKTIWKVTPSNDVIASYVYDNATFIFSKSGTYNIEATANGAIGKYVVNVLNDEYNDFGTDFNLIASKYYGIKKGEEVELKVANASFADWTKNVYPINVITDTLGLKAKVTFESTGIHEVVITSGNKTSVKTFWVDDNMSSNTYNAMLMLGDRLNVTPSVEQVAGKNVLVLYTTTTKKYHCSSDIILANSNDNSDIHLNYGGVQIANQPCTNSSVATAKNTFANITLGTYPFFMSYQNQQFHGEVTLDSTGVYSFIWQDNSSIRFTKLSTK